MNRPVLETEAQALADATAKPPLPAGIDGPVVLVGHSYGGCVISDAARGAANVKALRSGARAPSNCLAGSRAAPSARPCARVIEEAVRTTAGTGARD